MNEELTHVLLVEDNPDQSELMQRVFKRQSPPVRTTPVARGDDCLEMLRQNSYSAVLLDYSLPGMDGVTVLKEIRRRGYQVPVIMVTGQGDERVAVEAMREGASDYLMKTSGYLTTLPTILAKVLKQHELAMENVRLYEETQRNLERMRVLHEIEMAVTSTLDLPTVLDLLLKKIDLVLPYSATTVRLLNQASGHIEPIACRNIDDEEYKAEKWKAGRGPSAAVVKAKAPIMVRNIQADARVRDPDFFRKQQLVSYLGVPLISKGEVFGILSFYTKEEHQFSTEEIEFLSTLAGQAAIAIKNSQLYEQTRTQAVEMEKANKVKDEFLSVMSHELRTPLNVIIGYTDMIRDGMLGEINQRQEKSLGKIIDLSKDLFGMIASILQTTSIEAGAVEVESHEVDLGSFLDDFKSTYDGPSDKELALNWDYPSDLPSLKTDSDRLKHILQNLINNAIKFTDRGHVTVSVRHFPEAKEVDFKVMDTGIGIPGEMLPVIFEMFRQGDSSETRVYGGVGLGLYIVKKLTGLLGGKIDVESKPGKGSTFTVTLPYRQEAEGNRQ